MTYMKPCPFCGGTRLKVKPVWTDYRFVACLDCKAAGSVAKTDEKAIELWNQRAATEIRGATQKCSETTPNVDELRRIAEKLRVWEATHYPATKGDPLQYIGKAIGAMPGDHIMAKLADVLDPRPTCETCENYIGGGDWGLCCRLKYDLCYEYTAACESYHEEGADDAC